VKHTATITEVENGVKIVRRKERFSNELALVFATGQTLILNESKKEEEAVPVDPGRSFEMTEEPTPNSAVTNLEQAVVEQDFRLGKVTMSDAVQEFAERFDCDLYFSWSPDGRQLLYAGTDGMHFLDPENGETGALTTPQQCNLGFSPTFSPDGQWIAFSCLLDANYDLHVLPAKGGASKALTRVKKFPSPLAWSADSKRIVYSENGDLFEVSKDGGKPRRLTFAHDASQPAISTRGERLAYSQGRANVNLWRVNLRLPGRASTALMFPTSRQERAPQISPDGKRIAFESERSGSHEIWVSNLDGGDALQLSNFHSWGGSPRWSPDGQQIVFDSRVSGEPGLYLVDLHTALPKRVATNGLTASIPSWSNDGKWIYFRSGTKDDVGSLYRVSPQGGNPQLVSQTRGYNVQESTSGSLLYFIAGVRYAPIQILNTATGEERPLEGMPRVSVVTDWVLGSKGIFLINRSSAQPSIDFFEFASRRRYETHSPPEAAGVLGRSCTRSRRELAGIRSD
jgi:Tol biopolymer transport system component